MQIKTRTIGFFYPTQAAVGKLAPCEAKHPITPVYTQNHALHVVAGFQLYLIIQRMQEFLVKIIFIEYVCVYIHLCQDYKICLL